MELTRKLLEQKRESIQKSIEIAQAARDEFADVADVLHWESQLGVLELLYGKLDLLNELLS